MSTWSLDDIAWDRFDPAKAHAKPELVSLVKAASMVEHNGYDYARYLCEVFPDDAEFREVALAWAEEEVQHGRALRKWAELADPAFDFEKSFRVFTEGYKLPVNVEHSVRGSRAGELIARCVVETGTSSYYTAIREATDEPVLQSISAKIAADEFRHYKMFYEHLKRYLERDGIRFGQRLRIALSRIAESEDDELAYAFFAAHRPDTPQAYDHRLYKNLYLALALRLYRRRHIERATRMVLKVCDIRPREWLTGTINTVLWSLMRLRGASLRGYGMERLAAA
jgi:rubrerythrin